MVQTAFETRLVRKIPRVADIVSFQFERPEDFDYKPGQWMVVTLPDSSLAHHFTLSSSPSESFLEITTRLRDSEFKKALTELPVDAMIEAEGPFGSFFLPPSPGKVAFLTGGIGITAPRSILRHLIAARAADGPDRLVLLFANRSDRSIPFEAELKEMTAEFPQLEVIHVISRPSSTWEGRNGHIDAALLQEELGNLRSWNYFLSGPPDLGTSLGQILAGQGVERQAITSEQYLGYE